MKILIAEDNQVVREVLKQRLTQLGHDVVVTSNGLEAWQIYERETVPLIVCDWIMPELDGLELCRKMRSQPQAEYTYFIMLTVRSAIDDYHTAMAAGVDDFLTKNLDPEELLIRLRVAERILTFAKQVKHLQGLLPICSYCKRVRNDKDYWQQIENYIHEQTGTDFSHGICPECYQNKVEPELRELQRKTKETPGAE